MIIEFDPLALLELNDAVEYYNFKLAGLGNRFKDDVRIGINRILEYPDAWQHQTSRTRRFVLNSFPYKIIVIRKHWSLFSPGISRSEIYAVKLALTNIVIERN